MNFRAAIGALFCLATFVVSAQEAPERVASVAENVFLITGDGLRWEEVFSGAEAALITRDAGGVKDTNRLAESFWRDSPQARRSALLPFFWSAIAEQGQLFGNRRVGSVVKVTNGRNFTYPGFNEILTGFADDAIKSNAKIPNANVTVLEWLNRKPAYTNRVAAFPNWDVFPYILNSRRAGIPIWTGYAGDTITNVTPAFDAVDQMARQITPVWDGMNFDVFYHRAALEYVKARKPRVVWIAYSETDEWAHEGRYDLYLNAAHRMDSYVAALWNFVQSLPEYRDKTTFLLTSDHGRGGAPVEWKNHGAAVSGSEFIWFAAIGAGVAPRGERRDESFEQNQVAGTLATLLGESYNAAIPRAGKPINLK